MAWYDDFKNWLDNYQSGQYMKDVEDTAWANKLNYEDDQDFYDRYKDVTGVNIHADEAIPDRQIPGTPIIQQGVPASGGPTNYQMFGEMVQPNISNYTATDNPGSFLGPVDYKVTEEDLAHNNDQGYSATAKRMQMNQGQIEIQDPDKWDNAVEHGPKGRPIFKHPDVVTDLSHGPKGRPKQEKHEKQIDTRGWFKKQWDKFTDKDSTAPRNLLDFGMAMMERSEGAGDNFLKVVGQSVGDTVSKADARKLASLQSAKDDAKAKVDKADTLTSIQTNIIDSHTTEVESMDGSKQEIIDWNAVALAMREADPDSMFWNDDYLAHMVNNKIGMPNYNKDEEAYELPIPNNQENINVYNNNLSSILMMNADKEPKEIKIIVGDRVMTLASILQAGGEGMEEALTNQKQEDEKKKPWYQIWGPGSVADEYSY